MSLNPDQIRDKAAAYRASEAFAVVEQDRLETLPQAFREGTFHWKDCEWIVRWYCRRPLTGDVHSAETAFRQNRMKTVATAITNALARDDLREQLAALLVLDGVDVPIASAFLHYMVPEAYCAMTAQTWAVLTDAGHLDTPYPASPTPEAYERYLDCCRALATTANVSLIAVERALWRIGRDTED